MKFAIMGKPMLPIFLICAIILYVMQKNKNSLKQIFVREEYCVIKRRNADNYSNLDNNIRSLWSSGDFTAEGPTENRIYHIINPNSKIFPTL